MTATPPGKVNYVSEHHTTTGRQVQRTQSQVGDVSVTAAQSPDVLRPRNEARCVHADTVSSQSSGVVGRGGIREAKEGGCGCGESLRVVEELAEEEVACTGGHDEYDVIKLRREESNKQTGREGMLRQACEREGKERVNTLLHRFPSN